MSDIRTIYLSASDLSDLITKKELILNLSYCDKILLKLDGGWENVFIKWRIKKY